MYSKILLIALYGLKLLRSLTLLLPSKGQTIIFLRGRVGNFLGHIKKDLDGRKHSLVSLFVFSHGYPCIIFSSSFLLCRNFLGKLPNPPMDGPLLFF